METADTNVFLEMSDRELKHYAFPYHYGTFRDADEAKASIAGQAAAEQARRAGVELHEPALFGDMFKRLEKPDVETIRERYRQGNY